MKSGLPKKIQMEYLIFSHWLILWMRMEPVFVRMKVMKRILLTGGGTAGHVTPNLALIPRLKEDGWEIHYIGAADSAEEAPAHHIVADTVALTDGDNPACVRSPADPLNHFHRACDGSGGI